MKNEMQSVDKIKYAIKRMVKQMPAYKKEKLFAKLRDKGIPTRFNRINDEDTLCRIFKIGVDVWNEKE